MTTGITRRAMLSTLPAVLAAQTLSRSRPKAKPQIPSVGEFVRFSDPTTETNVVRLTTLKSSAFLPSPLNRFVSLKDRYLVFSSDRNGGVLAPYQVDLRNGAVRQLASATQLVPQSPCLDAKEQWLYFLDGGSLRRVETGKKDLRHHQSDAPLAQEITSFNMAPTGQIFAVRGSGGDLVQIAEGQGEPVLWAAGLGAQSCLAQPGQTAGCLFTRAVSQAETEFWYLNSAGSTTKPVLLARGPISNPLWAPDGESVLFLRDVPRGDFTLSEIHAVTLAGGAGSEVFVSPTSQFASFTANFDASVFVGASRSKAQPTVVLLLRSAKREMTLCQHHASHPAAVGPAFSPDARRVYFSSDEEGKPAIYSVNVEQLVEPPSDNKTPPDA